MSGKFDSRDRNWLVNITKSGQKIGEFEETILATSFDAETNQDIIDIEKNIKATKFLKKVAYMKLAFFIPEYITMFFLFPKKYSDAKKDVAKLYLKFIKNKIELNEFKKQLQIALKGSIL